jgi:hypothetical protein
LVFVRNPGDPWAFTIIGDRLPLAAIIVLIYFGVMRSHRVLGLTMLVVLVALLAWTAPAAGARVSRCITCRECTGPIPRILSRRLLRPALAGEAELSGEEQFELRCLATYGDYDNVDGREQSNRPTLFGGS